MEILVESFSQVATTVNGVFLFEVFKQ